MKPIYSPPSASLKEQFDGQRNAANPNDEATKRMNGESWNVEGEGFVLQGYRSPGQQMALGRKLIFSLPSWEAT